MKVPLRKSIQFLLPVSALIGSRTSTTMEVSADPFFPSIARKAANNKVARLAIEQ